MTQCLMHIINTGSVNSVKFAEFTGPEKNARGRRIDPLVFNFKQLTLQDDIENDGIFVS